MDLVSINPDLNMYFSKVSSNDIQPFSCLRPKNITSKRVLLLLMFINLAGIIPFVFVLAKQSLWGGFNKCIKHFLFLVYKTKRYRMILSLQASRNQSLSSFEFFEFKKHSLQDFISDNIFWIDCVAWSNPAKR